MKFDIKDVERTLISPNPNKGAKVTHNGIRYLHKPTGIWVEETILAGYKLFELDRKLMAELIELVEEV